MEGEVILHPTDYGAQELQADGQTKPKAADHHQQPTIAYRPASKKGDRPANRPPVFRDSSGIGASVEDGAGLASKPASQKGAIRNPSFEDGTGDRILKPGQSVKQKQSPAPSQPSQQKQQQQSQPSQPGEYRSRQKGKSSEETDHALPSAMTDQEKMPAHSASMVVLPRDEWDTLLAALRDQQTQHQDQIASLLETHVARVLETQVSALLEKHRVDTLGEMSKTIDKQLQQLARPVRLNRADLINKAKQRLSPRSKQGDDSSGADDQGQLTAANIVASWQSSTLQGFTASETAPAASNAQVPKKPDEASSLQSMGSAGPDSAGGPAEGVVAEPGHSSSALVPSHQLPQPQQPLQRLQHPLPPTPSAPSQQQSEQPETPEGARQGTPLAPGSRVVVRGVTREDRGQYNERRGVIKSYQKEKQKWIVKLDDGELISVFPENLHAEDLYKSQSSTAPPGSGNFTSASTSVRDLVPVSARLTTGSEISTTSDVLMPLASEQLTSSSGAANWNTGNYREEDDPLSSMLAQPGVVGLDRTLTWGDDVEHRGSSSSDTPLKKKPKKQVTHDASFVRDSEVSDGEHLAVMSTKNNAGSAPVRPVKSVKMIAQELEAQHRELCCCRRHARRIGQLRFFEASVAGLIMLNAVMIGVQADWAIKNLGAQPPLLFRYFDLFFTIAFAFELVIHLLDEWTTFLSPKNQNFYWNCFDSLVVGSALAEEFLAIASLVTANDGGEAATPDVSAIRVLRILRLVRVLRVVRVMRFFSDLRAMIFGIMSSVKSLAWCLLLLLLLMFVFGVCFMQLIPDAIKDSDIEADLLLFFFGSMIRTVYTLYCSITGGVDWGDVAEPLMQISSLLGLLFAMYVAFAVLCVLNIVTGVFVENANKIIQNDTDHMIMQELQARDEWLSDCQKVFLEADLDESGNLDCEEFERYVSDETVQAYFRRIGLNVESDNSHALFNLVDFDGDGVITMEEFVEGCAQVVGTARQLDIARLKHETKQMEKMLLELIALCHANFANKDFSEDEYIELQSTFQKSMTGKRQYASKQNTASLTLASQHWSSAQSDSTSKAKRPSTEEALESILRTSTGSKRDITGRKASILEAPHPPGSGIGFSADTRLGKSSDGKMSARARRSSKIAAVRGSK